jgi:hypothetical protein
MRTKILLTAAAALVAGLVSSNAQVYSANIVGYTIKVPSNAPSYSLICNPVDSGSNTIKNLFANNPPPGGSQVLTWSGSAYQTLTYSTLLGGHWKMNAANDDSNLLSPGQGFFIQVAGANSYSNTFVGQVTPLTSVVTTNPVPSGFQLIASSVPYGDYVTNPATINLTGVAGGTQILLWNEPNQSFDTYTWSSLLGGHWKLGAANVTPFLNVGQGFFFGKIKNSKSTHRN